MIELPHGFDLRPYQLEAFKAYFEHDIKRLLLIWHRRAGKTKMILNFMIAAAMQRVGTYYHAFPEREQAKKNIWDGIDKDGKRYLDHIPQSIIRNINNSELKIELINGSIIRLVGTDRYNALVGGNPVGIIYDEYAIQNPLAWDYLRPVLAENDGWAAFVTTPRGKNHLFDMYTTVRKRKNWFVSVKGINDTKDWNGSAVLSESVIDEERDSGMEEDKIQQEFYVSFEGGIQGAYYTDQIQFLYGNGKIKDLEIDTTKLVYTFWDIGYKDATTIWFFQQVGSELRFIDYYEQTYTDYDENYEYILGFAKANNIKYGRHYAPHDIEHRQKTSGGKSARDICGSMGLHFITAPSHSIQDGIQMVRHILPKCTFSQDRCKRGLRCLQEYHKRYDDIKRVFSDKPVHNWASHGADAFRIFAICYNKGLGDNHIIRQLPPMKIKL